MREILFRGKRTDNDEWVEGFYLYTNENTQPVIIDMECCSNVIIPETVGQYTGLTDKNGVRIFEGDILGGFLDEEYPEHETVAVVEWRKCMWVTHQRNCHPDLLEESDMDWFEVIGNIHDNPELLKGGADNDN